MAGVREGQPSGPAGLQSPRRAFGLLETLAENGPIGLSQLAAESGLPPEQLRAMVAPDRVAAAGAVDLGSRAARATDELVSGAVPVLNRTARTLADGLGTAR